jgi:RNA polymerase sigma-32 factor
MPSGARIVIATFGRLGAPSDASWDTSGEGTMAHIDDSETHRANTAFIGSAMRVPLLERDHELALARRWRERGDQAALHALVTAHTRLVVSIATRFRHYGLPMGDLVQEGNLGLMEAAARFEPARDVRFSTYATWWIRANMQEFILRNWSIVRTGTTAAQKTLFFNLRRLRARLDDGAAESLSAESEARIARVLAVRVVDVAEMGARLARSDQSLNVAIGEDGHDERQDLLADTRPDPEQAAAEHHDRRLRLRWLAAALTELGPRERAIIQRHQLDDDGATLSQIGRRLGISKERVRQIEQTALAKLRLALERQSAEARDLIPE